MSIFDQSTPEDFIPEQDTIEDSAELENEYSEEPSDEETTESEAAEREGSDPQGHSDDLIAGKFKTQADLLNAYKGLERKLHEQSQQHRPPVQSQQGNDENPRDSILRALSEDPIGVINYFVQQAVSPIQEERSNERLASSIENVAKEYKQINSEEGMGALFAKVGEMAQDFGNPNLARNPTPRVLKMAAEELWGKQTAAQVYEQAKAAGRQEAEASRRAKMGLNAPGSVKPKEAPKTAGESIAEGILAASRRSSLFG